MLRKINKLVYDVDIAMFGENFDGDQEDLIIICEIMQKLCNEKCLFVSINPILGLWNGANNSKNYSEYGYEIEWLLQEIPFWDAVNVFYEKNKND